MYAEYSIKRRFQILLCLNKKERTGAEISKLTYEIFDRQSEIRNIYRELRSMVRRGYLEFTASDKKYNLSTKGRSYMIEQLRSIRNAYDLE